MTPNLRPWNLWPSARLNLLCDWTLIVAAASAASPAGPRPGLFLWFAAAACMVWLVTATALRHYAPGVSGTREATDDAAMVSVLVMAMTTLLALFDFAFGRFGPVPRLSTFLIIFWPLALAARLLLFRAAPKEAASEAALIVGVGPMGKYTGEDLLKRGSYILVGYLRIDGEPVSSNLPAPVLGEVANLEKTLRTTPADMIFLAGSAVRQGDALQAAIHVCERLGVPFALPACAFHLGRATPALPRLFPEGYVQYQTVGNKPLQMAFKRQFDILVSAAALWILLPLFLAVMLLIKLTSRGPIFFKQIRVGLHGRPFNLLKFRSMVMNAEALKHELLQQNEQAGPIFKMQKDPRVTPLGRFLRKYSIDELPQLINVIRGDMSLVGPRPPLPSEVGKYEAWQLRRLSVRPGLTCIWQVSGRSAIPFEQWMYLDMQYIDHWNLGTDINLIVKTVPVVFSGRGAS